MNIFKKIFGGNSKNESQPKQQQEEQMEPNQNPNQSGQPGTGGQAAPQQQTPPQQTSLFNDLKQKKGFKSEEDLAKSYVDVETAYNKHQNITSKVKQQLEAAGYQLDDQGNIIQPQQPYGQPTQPQFQQPGGYQDVVYDPLTNQPITDPVALQMIKQGIPYYQQQIMLTNALLEQREKQSGEAYQAEQEFLTKPEVKGFEDDVKKVMMALPLIRRSKKEEWNDALLRVKGARYEVDRKNWAEQGVNQFINANQAQSIPGSPGQNSGTQLNQEQEQTYQWYAKNQPGLFKDRAHFLKANSPTYGA